MWSKVNPKPCKLEASVRRVMGRVWGPQFRGDFQKFCQENAIKHELSAPYNPESSGLAEAVVKSMRALIIKCTESKTDIKTGET
jgi:transposase InsO family protein